MFILFFEKIIIITIIKELFLFTTPTGGFLVGCYCYEFSENEKELWIFFSKHEWMIDTNLWRRFQFFQPFIFLWFKKQLQRKKARKKYISNNRNQFFEKNFLKKLLPIRVKRPKKSKQCLNQLFSLKMYLDATLISSIECCGTCEQRIAWVWEDFCWNFNICSPVRRRQWKTFSTQSHLLDFPVIQKKIQFDQMSERWKAMDNKKQYCFSKKNIFVSWKKQNEKNQKIPKKPN